MKTDRQLKMEELARDFDILCRTSGKEHHLKTHTIQDLYDELINGMILQHYYRDSKTKTVVCMAIDVLSEDSPAPVTYKVFTVKDDELWTTVAFWPASKDEFSDMLIQLQDYYDFPLTLPV